MAKKKRKHSVTHSESGSPRIWPIVRKILSWFVLLFVMASLFNAGGSVGTYIYNAAKYILGGLSPMFAVIIVWLVAKKYLPDQLKLRALTIFGWILFIVFLAGVFHGLAGNDFKLSLTNNTGGGIIGYQVIFNLTQWLGDLMGRLIIYVMVLVSILLIFEKILVKMIVHEPTESEDEPEDGPTINENSVPVKGELKTGGAMSLFKNKLSKPTIIKVDTSKAPVHITPKPTFITNWLYPPTTLLEKIEMKPQSGNIQKRIEIIEKTLRDFGIEVKMTDVNIGPTVTQFTLRPSEGVKLNQITARQDDLALALSAQSLRVEAPIPGKGLVGVEIPNDKKAIVGLREIIESKTFKALSTKLGIALGRDAAGAEAVADLTRMPHMLIAGATGSGKSVCINSIIISLLINNSPDELRLIMVDPKRVELTYYNGLPHLLTPVITEPQDTVKALAWCVKEMERRYKLFASHGKRNIDQYNAEPDLGEGHLPYIVLIIDELADLMMVAAREVEGSIVRLAQMARAVGIHLIIATQRPSVDVITGLIKANFPTRIAFAVASQVDSRTILDVAGAEKLLGYGDMLFMSTEIGKPRRMQGVFVPEKDITSIIAHIKLQEDGDRYDPAVLETRVESRLGSNREIGDVDDELFEDALEVVKQAGRASTTLLQTRLSVGYARAARLMQNMEDQGLIGPANGSKPREVYGRTTITSRMDNVSEVDDFDQNN